MAHPGDTNAAIWRSEQYVSDWAAAEKTREPRRAAARRLLADLLPFGEQDAFTFADLGAGTGAATRTILERYPRATAIMADFSAQMMAAGAPEMRPFAGRYSVVEFDLSGGRWPAAIPAALDAVVTSMCVHHLPGERRRSLFAEICARLAPGGWYLNFDPVRSDDPVVTAAWERAGDREDPQAAHQRHHRTAADQAGWDNHVRYIAPLAPQLDDLRAAGFGGVDVYYKRLENVIYGGCRPA